MFFPSKKNVLKLALLIKDTQKTLDIAMFIITNKILSKAIISAKNKGATVNFMSIESTN